MATAGHRDLIEKGGRNALLETLQKHTKKQQNVKKIQIFMQQRKDAHRASSKATKVFLTK
jgi:Tfp pilus assembly protein PilN